MKAPIPKQFVGKKLDYSRTIVISDPASALERYSYIVGLLLQVNEWHHITKGPSAEFKLMDSTGQAVEGNIFEGVCLRIDIPGPGLPSADGYDWVRVEKLTHEQEAHGRIQRTTLQVRPTPDPTNDNPDTAHFFQDMATSSFIITLEDTEIEVMYAGRNELVNTNNSSNWDNIRNFFVGITAKIGASYPQWKALVDGLCEAPTKD